MGAPDVIICIQTGCFRPSELGKHRNCHERPLTGRLEQAPDFPGAD
jgi:hypothetical protein